MLKLGSLFDGSGGFPLAGVLHGVEPVWASEIEPYPVKVTTARFPNMRHLGDVTKIDGAAIEPVDIITFGSPCQDLSVAGKQAGLHKGERSNLFFEAIRIIKEMRESTDGIYPRIAVWENVPGAYSSNKGEDFRAVLQAFVRLREQAADVPMPKGNKWATAGCVVGNGYSIAWRTLDAQYNGVPQRRRRIYLIADFGSERAGEILFEQEGLRGHSAESGTAGQSAAGDAEGSVGRGVLFDAYQHHGWRIGESCNTLTAGQNGSIRGDTPLVCQSVDCRNMNLTNEHGTLQAKENGGQSLNYMGAVCYALQGNGIDRADTAGCNGARWRENECYTLNTIDRPAVAYSAGNGQLHQALEYEKARPLDCMHDQQIVLHPSKPPRRYIIRRLTPLECLRLQGLPDGWLDGVDGSDSAKYKMLGNGIAMPNAIYVVGCAVQLLQEGKHENEG